MDIIIVTILLLIIIGIIIAIIFLYINYIALKDELSATGTKLNASLNSYEKKTDVDSKIITIKTALNSELTNVDSNFDTVDAFSKQNLSNITDLMSSFSTINSNLTTIFGNDTATNSRFPNEQIFKYTVNTETDAFNDFSLMKDTIINGNLTIKGLTKMCDINDLNCFSFDNSSSNLDINGYQGTDINNNSYLNINTKTKLKNNLYSCDTQGNNCYYTGIDDTGKYTFQKKQPDVTTTDNTIYSIVDNKLNIDKNNLIFQEDNSKFRIKKCDKGNGICYEYYDTTTDTWVSPDPIGETGQQVLQGPIGETLQ